MDQAQKDALKATLTQDFNRVGSKVVKVSDFMSTFDALAKKGLNFVERGLVNSQKPSIDFKDEKLRALIRKGTDGCETGIYFSADGGKVIENEATAYVSSDVLKKVVMNNVDTVNVPGPVQKLADKVRKIVVDALVECPDHSAQLKAGKLKPMVV